MDPLRDLGAIYRDGGGVEDGARRERNPSSSGGGIGIVR